MVMLAKYILMELADCHPRVIVVTDRKDLDRQITATFAHTRLTPARATSGRNLVKLLNSGKADVVTTIINKFNTAEKMEQRNFSRDVFCWWTRAIVPTMACLRQRCARYFPTPVTSALPARPS